MMAVMMMMIDMLMACCIDWVSVVVGNVWQCTSAIGMLLVALLLDLYHVVVLLLLLLLLMQIVINVMFVGDSICMLLVLCGMLALLHCYAAVGGSGGSGVANAAILLLLHCLHVKVLCHACYCVWCLACMLSCS